MIRFIDINTGRTFNGNQPYIHWFDGQQSIGLIYNQNIYIISDKSSLNIKLDDDSIFHIIDPDIINSQNISINDFIYKDITSFYKKSIVLSGNTYNDRYIYYVNLAARCDEPLEARVNMIVDDEVFTVGADFHDEREELKINLGNQGLEIPESIQKAIYDSNVHEEGKDNILLNRKYKELLLDFINIVGNKGSYKSLSNSLNWFEYGELLKIHEYWKHSEWNRTLYNDQEFQQILYKDLQMILSNYSKSTYIGVYCAYEHEQGYEMNVSIGSDQFLAEPVPELVKTSFKWSVVDMALKMTLLGNFFKTYFMPIHLDLLMCTMEDVVYTESIKILGGITVHREDYIIHNQHIKCNIKNGDSFVLDQASCESSSSTPFSNNEIDSYDHIIVGIDEDPAGVTDEENLKRYFLNRYNGVGSIIPFRYEIKVDNNDVIYKEDVLIGKKDSNNNFVTSHHIFDHKYTPSDGKIVVEFKLLCTEDTDYDFRIMFHSTSNQTYVHRVIFSVIDTRKVSLSLYSVKANDLWRKDDRTSNIFNFEHWQRSSIDLLNRYYPQYIPTTIDSSSSDVRLITLLALRSLYGSKSLEQVIDEIIGVDSDMVDDNGDTITFAQYIFDHDGELPLSLENELGNLSADVIDLIICWQKISRLFIRFDKSDAINPRISSFISTPAYIYIAKDFDTTMEQSSDDSNNGPNNSITLSECLDIIKDMFHRHSYNNVVLRVERIYMPQLHHLESFNRDTERSCHINQYNVLCAIPDIKFTRYIDSVEWIFHNASNNTDYTLPSVLEPFVLSGDQSSVILPKGYYDVIFRYRLSSSDKVHEISLKSAFVKD